MKHIKLVKKPFNLASTKQLQAILCDKKQKSQAMKQHLADTTFNNNKEKQEQEEAQANIAYALPTLIAAYRSIAKLKSNYTDKLPQMINQLSKRIHTSYHQAITATGRLSSSYPNLQNIPVRNNAGRRIRQAFIAPQDTLILAADYSQIKLRIITHLSSDPGLLTTFATGKDIHRATAAEVFGLPFDNVTQDQRRRAKAINFGLIYGMSAFGLSRQLSIPQLAAQKYMNRYFQRHPGVLEYMERTRKTGY